MAGPRSPTSPVTAQLISRRWKVISLWCYADCQQRSNQRLVVLPQTRSSSFHGVKHFSRLHGMKLFKNIRFYGWAVLPQTRPNSFHGVEEPFRLDDMHTFKTIQVYGWAASQHPLSRPSSFRSVEKSFRFDVMQIFNNLQINGWSCSPKHDPVHFTVSNNFLVWMVWSFSKTFDFMAGPCSPKHGPVPFTMIKNLFVWMLCSHLKPFKLMAAPRSPTSPVTAQLNSQSWITFSSWCYADCQQRSNLRLVVLLQTRCSSFHGVKTFLVWMVWSFSKAFNFMAGFCSPKHGSVLFTRLKNFFSCGCYAAI